MGTFTVSKNMFDEIDTLSQDAVVDEPATTDATDQHTPGCGHMLETLANFDAQSVQHLDLDSVEVVARTAFIRSSLFKEFMEHNFPPLMDEAKTAYEQNSLRPKSSVEV